MADYFCCSFKKRISLHSGLSHRKFYSHYIFKKYLKTSFLATTLKNLCSQNSFKTPLSNIGSIFFLNAGTSVWFRTWSFESKTPGPKVTFEGQFKSCAKRILAFIFGFLISCLSSWTSAKIYCPAIKLQYFFWKYGIP